MTVRAHACPGDPLCALTSDPRVKALETKHQMVSLIVLHSYELPEPNLVLLIARPKCHFDDCLFF